MKQIIQQKGLTAIYVRRSVSDSFNGNNSLSINAQKEEYIRFVGDEPYRIYCDDGKSGKDRPAFIQMMQDARDGLISRIVVKKYDRFSRNMREYLNITDELDRYGVSVYSLSEPFNTSTKEGRIPMNTLVFAAEGSSPQAVVSNDISCNESADKVVFDDVLNGNTRSLSVPTSFYDLSTSNYYADLQEVRVSWLYTNYYFYGNSQNKLHVTYTIYSDTGRHTKMKVGLYDINDGEMKTSWTSSGSTLDGITESFNFINLNPNHKYAVAFTAVYDGFTYDSVHGSATISH